MDEQLAWQADGRTAANVGSCSDYKNLRQLPDDIAEDVTARVELKTAIETQAEHERCYASPASDTKLSVFLLALGALINAVVLSSLSKPSKMWRRGADELACKPESIPASR